MEILERFKKQREKWGKNHNTIIDNLKQFGPKSTDNLAKICKLSRPTIDKHLKLDIRAVKIQGKWIWCEQLITPSEMKELPEILRLKEACEKGDLLHAFNRPDFFKLTTKNDLSHVFQDKKYKKHCITKNFYYILVMNIVGLLKKGACL